MYLGCITTMLLGGCAIAEPSEPSEPAVLQDEHLKTEIPSGWVQVLNSKTPNLMISEYLPANSPDPWQQKLSIEAMSAPQLPDPLQFVDGWAFDQSKLCNDFEDLPIHAGYENGYQSVVRMLVCGENKRTGKPLVTMIKVIRGNEALYTITRIWRLESLPPPQSEIAVWSNALSKTIACHPALAAHPCPE